MSNGNPTASSGTHERVPDTETLVSLLQNLMPLLLEIQRVQPFRPRLEPADFVHNAMLDHHAAASLVQDITGDCLRTLSSYLETHAGRHAELQGCVGLVTEALYRFAAGDYAQTFALIWQTYRTLAALRAANPELPPLRTLGPSSPPITSIH
jgi:hypothetical protein